METTEAHKSKFFVEFVCQTSMILNSELASYLLAKFSRAPTLSPAQQFRQSQINVQQVPRLELTLCAPTDNIENR